MEKTRKMLVLGHELNLKNYNCSINGGPYAVKPEDLKLQLSICPTHFCPGRCPFCVAAADRGREEKLDIKKLENTLLALKKEDVIRGISITGGEPTLDMGLLNEVINLCFDIFTTDLELCLHTNGMGLKDIKRLEKLQYVESIRWSRHHYDEEVNRKLYGGFPVPTNTEAREIIESVSYKDIFVFNCLLMKDYIGNSSELHKFMDFCLDMQVPKAGFVTPMVVNEFTRQQQVKYEEVLRNDDEQLLFTRNFQDYEVCKCQDGVYVSEDGRIMEFYGRTTCPGDCEYVRGFVYGADNTLRTGFSSQAFKFTI